MGLFDKLKGPIFYKDDSDAEQQLRALEDLTAQASGAAAEAIAREIQIVKTGIDGERRIRFELENSHIPMYVLHDLFLEHNGLTSQIDYLIITRFRQYVIECKNLFGDIEINSNGDFIRTLTYGKIKKKEGIYSPITQNRRHLELIKEMRGEGRGVLSKALFEKNFYNYYQSVVVLANPKTVLNTRYAKKAVKDQVIRADQLAEYIRARDSAPGSVASSEKDMENLARFFMDANKKREVDYTERFREMLANESEAKTEAHPEPATDDEVVKCPRCGAPMVKRKAVNGKNAGKCFYGCSAYPKCRGIVPID